MNYLVERIRQALVERIGELDVQATVAGNKLFLTGTVGTEGRLRAVTEVAAELAPEHEIHNQISVIGLSEPSEMEELR